MSFTEIGKKMSVQKNRVKQILANKNVFVIGRDEIKKEFTETEKQRIINLYLNNITFTALHTMSYAIQISIFLHEIGMEFTTFMRYSNNENHFQNYILNFC